MSVVPNQPMRGNVTVGRDRVWNLPRCRVWNSVGETGHGPGLGAIGFDTTTYDTDGMATLGVIGVTCRTAGAYLFTAGIYYSTGAGPRQTFFRLNGVTAYGAVLTAVNAGGGVEHNISDVIPLNAGDAVALMANTLTDASNLPGGQQTLYMTATLLSTTN